MLFFIVGYGLINLVVDHFRVLPAVWWQATAGQLVSGYDSPGFSLYRSAVQRFILHPITLLANRSFPPSRLKSPLRVLWGLLFIAVQLPLFYGERFSSGPHKLGTYAF